ncbi:amidase [Solimonas soli]|uniref:amidase n=1 Tax=Solimonas soli TaxID=413479 RepID=UPI000488CD31|nr:amidase [Solimonas soli]
MDRTVETSRRRFLAVFSSLGLSGTLLPGVLWAQLQAQGAGSVDAAMIRDAAALAGLAFSDAEIDAMIKPVTQSLARMRKIREATIPNDVAPPFYFSPLTPGMVVERRHRPPRFAATGKVRRPANLEAVAFWPVTRLSALIKSRQVTSLELTQMYLSRLRQHNARLNCVVTMLDDVAIAQAKQADAELAAGHDRGPLHGVPWGAKDIISVKGYRTTWGSGAYKDQVFDYDASVVEILREAGAVLLAKLATGELAGGDQWWGGRTNNPWRLDEGSSGSSAGPGAATAAGCVPFAIGTETGGSILSPSARCGVTGLRPTFGRVSRYGVMALSWTQDRLGPMCRSVEDCAVVLGAIARPDGRDLSVGGIPFNWDATLDWRRLKVGYLPAAFDDAGRDADWKRNDQATLDQLREMGVTLVPLNVPDFDIETVQLSVEAAVFFDDLLRSGRYRQMTNTGRADRFRAGRLIPAVDYLQSQRMRSIMMRELAAATAGVDVYLAPSTLGEPRPPEGADAPLPSPCQRHSQMANLACYPGLALPNGFAASGAPTSVLFMAQPYAEARLLALAKAYQDATAFHLRQPPLFAVA